MKKYCTEDMELRRANIVEANSMALDSEMPSETYEDMNIIYVPFVRETAERKCTNIYFEKKVKLRMKVTVGALSCHDLINMHEHP